MYTNKVIYRDPEKYSYVYVELQINIHTLLYVTWVFRASPFFIVYYLFFTITIIIVFWFYLLVLTVCRNKNDIVQSFFGSLFDSFWNDFVTVSCPIFYFYQNLKCYIFLRSSCVGYSILHFWYLAWNVTQRR